MNIFKIEVWRDRSGGFSWHAKSRNGRIVTTSESFTRFRPVKRNILAAYPETYFPDRWKLRAKILTIFVGEFRSYSFAYRLPHESALAVH